MRVLLSGLALVLTGCLSPGTSATSRLWEFPAVAQTSSARIKIVLPSSLRRPTVVTTEAEARTIHDLDRWSTPLGEALARQVAAHLHDLPIREVVLTIERLDVALDGKVELLFLGEVVLETSPDNPGIPLSMNSGVLKATAVPVAEGQPALSAALASYRQRVPKLMANRIRAEITARQTGVGP